MKFDNKKKFKNSDFTEIFGHHAVYAALQNPKRIHEKLFISNSQKKTLLNNDFLKFIKEINELTNKDMNKIFGNESNHQGLVLRTSKLKQPSLEDILYNKSDTKNDLIVILDQITDPQNIGSIMRSCSLFNCNSIIVSDKNSPNITASMAKTASGAIEVVNYIQVVNLSRTILELKKNNYWIYGLDGNTSNSVKDFDLPKKCVLVFGSEGRGLRDLTKKDCDAIISISIKSQLKFKIDSLNVSNACSIALYEHFKKYRN